MSSITQGLKETCTKIVGHWYCEQIKQHFIFDFNDQLLRMAPLTVINTQGTFTTEYGVAVDMPEDPMDIKNYYYFDVGKFEKRYYKIDTLTKDMLVIREFWMIPDTKPASPLIYKRQTDISAADEILKGIDSEPLQP